MKKKRMSSLPSDTVVSTAVVSPSEEATVGSILTFQLATQRYGLPVTAVNQIVEIVAITHLPQMPQGIQGAINVHGRVVPVIDLRLRFGLDCMPYHLHTPLILVEADGQLLALIVDAVDDVVEVVLPAAEETAVVQVGQELIPLVNVAHLLNRQERQQLAHRLPPSPAQHRPITKTGLACWPQEPRLHE
ncbi:MAG: chemotaxis protein CheW [Anaerolineae bacterium]|nr:chemotaxis protein CheW [Anaerolineae bacterium]